MVLHVAGVGARVVFELAFELVEQAARVLAQRVDQHVQAAAVGHADHDVLDAVAAGAADHGVEQRDQGVAALEREALLADVLGVQVALQALGRGEALEDAALLVRGVAVAPARPLHALVHPAPLGGLGDVHELGTDRARVGGAEHGEQLAQAHARRAAEGAGAAAGAGGELGVEVGVGQAVEGQVEVRGRDLLGHAERIGVGLQVPARTVGGDQLEHRALLALGLRVDAAGDGHDAVPCLSAGPGDGVHDHRVRDVTGLAALEPVEPGLPRVADAGRVNEILLVQVLDECGVGTELGGLRKLLQETVHVCLVGLFLDGARQSRKLGLRPRHVGGEGKRQL